MIDGGGVIVRTERRRRYSDAEKATIVAESLRPDLTVTSVARRHGIAKSVIYNWRANRREAEAIAREALEFIPCGQFVGTSERNPASEIIPEEPEPSVGPLAADAEVSPPTEPPRAGTIAIELGNGARLTVDSIEQEPHFTADNPAISLFARSFCVTIDPCRINPGREIGWVRTNGRNGAWAGRQLRGPIDLMSNIARFAATLRRDCNLNQPA